MIDGTIDDIKYFESKLKAALCNDDHYNVIRAIRQLMLIKELIPSSIADSDVCLRAISLRSLSGMEIWYVMQVRIESR